MKQTVIRDTWVTDSANASHFGNGKIDALAGIEYILENYHNALNGDVNHDGRLSIDDITALIYHLLTPGSLICPTCADVDNDGMINISDITELINLLLNGEH